MVRNANPACATIYDYLFSGQQAAPVHDHLNGGSWVLLPGNEDQERLAVRRGHKPIAALLEIRDIEENASDARQQRGALHLNIDGHGSPRPGNRQRTLRQSEAEAHWKLRTYLRDKLISGLADEETAAQLSMIRYRENSRGLTEIESKEARNQRGIPGSPDRAESPAMALMRVVPQQTTVAWIPSLENLQISPI